MTINVQEAYVLRVLNKLKQLYGGAENAGRENAGHENAGHEIAGHKRSQKRRTFEAE